MVIFHKTRLPKDFFLVVDNPNVRAETGAFKFFNTGTEIVGTNAI